MEAIRFAADQNATMKLVPRWKKNKAVRTGLHDRAKARVISMFNPKVAAEERVDLLIQQLTEQREALPRTLVKYAQELGRREDGTLKFRIKNLKELQVLLDEKGVTLQVSQPAKEWLAEKGYEPAFGARPMARLVETQLKKPLADAILFGDLKDGGTAKVERKGEGLGIVTKAK